MNKIILGTLAIFIVVVTISGCTSANQTGENNTNVTPTTLEINSISGLECTVDEKCDIQVVQASGGEEPYSYESDSYGTGAPPMGTIIDINGHLTGTPSVEGDYDFGICVADATRTSECTQASIKIKSKASQKNVSSTKVDSFTCTYVSTDDYGDRHYELSASGSATSSEGAELQLVFNPGYYTKTNSDCEDCKSTCGSWDFSNLQNCARNGNTETTQWTVFVPSSEVISGATLSSVDNTVELDARIFIGTSMVTETTA